MKYTYRKFFALTAIAAMTALTLNGCGGKKEETTAAATTAAATTAAQTTAAATTAAPTTAAATKEETTAAETRAEAKGELLETDFFSIVMPEELDDLYEVSVTSDDISVYEKNSRESSGGFVFSIGAFADVNDYCHIPNFRRVGQVTDKGKQNYDLVAIYPSDVQFEPEFEEQYNKINDAVPGIIDAIEPAEGYTYTKQADIDTTGIYEGVLDELYKLVEAKTDRSYFAEHETFSYLFGFLDESEEKPLEKAGYCFMDLTGDGYDELLLGAIGDVTVYDLYAPVNGKPFHLFSSIERGRYFLTDVGVRYEGSGSAMTAVTTSYGLESQEEEIYPQVSLIYDSQKDEKNPWFVDYGGEEKPEAVSEADYEEILSRFSETREIKWTPLSEWKK